MRGNPRKTKSVAFRAFRRFNQPDLRPLSGRKFRLDHSLGQLFDGNSLGEKLARALGDQRAIPLKELFESFEFFERVRKRVRAKVVADLCCGHGLTGVLFAVYEPSVETVILIDQKCPASFTKIVEALKVVAPWAVEKLQYWEGDLQDMSKKLPHGTSILGVHACGGRTDQCIDVGIGLQGALALMPCCHSKSPYRGPDTLRHALGITDASDIERTYRLEALGYEVTWTAIPSEITAKPRVIVATKPR